MGLELDQRAALDFWRGVTVHAVKADGLDLTARQLAILLTVSLNPGPHTVRGLAADLAVGKPAISRALDVLTRHDLARRSRDEADGRNVLIEGTASGASYLASLGDLIRRRAAALFV